MRPWCAAHKPSPGPADQLFAAAQADHGIEAEDRDGVMRFYPMTTVSAGLLRVRPGTYQRAEHVASAAALAKHKAKQMASGIHIEP